LLGQRENLSLPSHSGAEERATVPTSRSELLTTDTASARSANHTVVSPALFRNVAHSLPMQNEHARALNEFLRRRATVARSFLIVGGGAISAGLIAAGLAYSANRTYGQKDAMGRGDAERANADLVRVQRTGTVATSLLGAGGAALVSGLALKLWNLKQRGSDTPIEGRLVAKPHKLGGMLALRGTWGVAL